MTNKKWRTRSVKRQSDKGEITKDEMTKWQTRSEKKTKWQSDKQEFTKDEMTKREPRNDTWDVTKQDVSHHVTKWKTRSDKRQNDQVTKVTKVTKQEVKKFKMGTNNSTVSLSFLRKKNDSAKSAPFFLCNGLWFNARTSSVITNSFVVNILSFQSQSGEMAWFTEPFQAVFSLIPTCNEEFFVAFFCFI